MDILKNLCEICQSEAKKYKCPACGIMTCSVSCSKQHKVESGCTGQIDSTKYVKRADMTSVTLDRDYNFLQATGRIIELGKRDIAGLIPSNVKRARKDGIRAGVHVISSPMGLERWKQNKSGWNKRKRQFCWTVEWRLVGSDCDDRVYLGYHGDTDSLINILSRDVYKKFDISEFSGVVGLEKVPRPSNKRKLIVVDVSQKLSDVLSGKKVLEFPVFYLVPSDMQHNYIIVKKSAKSTQECKSDASSDDSSDSSDESSQSSDESGDSSGDSSEDSSEDSSDESSDERNDQRIDENNQRNDQRNDENDKRNDQTNDQTNGQSLSQTSYQVDGKNKDENVNSSNNDIGRDDANDFANKLLSKGSSGDSSDDDSPPEESSSKM